VSQHALLGRHPKLQAWQSLKESFIMPVVSAQKFGLAIPTLNEAGNIAVLIERLHASLESLGIHYELIVVDDDSRDGTQEIVAQMAKDDPRLKLLVRKGERGLAGAVLCGWQHTDAELLGVIDADLQHPPEVLPKLVRAVEDGYDIAIASRYAQPDSVTGWNFARRLVSALGTWVTAPLQRPGLRVKDPLSGYFVLRRKCVDNVHLKPQGFKILLEILVRGNCRSAVEIPFQFGLRQAGESKANFKVALDYFFQLGRLSRALRLRPR
jgi:dolichol-phosphate mannosyltransferase